MLYEVQPERTLEGDLRGRSVTVVLPGGLVKFSNGSTAQLLAEGFIRPQPNLQYVWFLRRALPQDIAGQQAHIAEGGAYIPVHGPLGVYTTRPLPYAANSHVKPSGATRSTLARLLVRQPLTLEAFLTEIQRVVR